MYINNIQHAYMKDMRVWKENSRLEDEGNKVNMIKNFFYFFVSLKLYRFTFRHDTMGDIHPLGIYHQHQHALCERLEGMWGELQTRWWRKPEGTNIFCYILYCSSGTDLHTTWDKWAICTNKSAGLLERHTGKKRIIAD